MTFYEVPPNPNGYLYLSMILKSLGVQRDLLRLCIPVNLRGTPDLTGSE